MITYGQSRIVCMELIHWPPTTVAARAKTANLNMASRRCDLRGRWIQVSSRYWEYMRPSYIGLALLRGLFMHMGFLLLAHHGQSILGFLGDSSRLGGANWQMLIMNALSLLNLPPLPSRTHAMSNPHIGVFKSCDVHTSILWVIRTNYLISNLKCSPII